MSYPVYWTSLAQEDLASTITYLLDVRKAPTAAQNLLEDIEKETSVLSENPYNHPLTYDVWIAEKGIRHLLVKNYFIFYSLNENTKTITVIRMLYARRDWIQLLKGYPLQLP